MDFDRAPWKILFEHGADFKGSFHVSFYILREGIELGLSEIFSAGESSEVTLLAFVDKSVGHFCNNFDPHWFHYSKNRVYFITEAYCVLSNRSNPLSEVLF